MDIGLGFQIQITFAKCYVYGTMVDYVGAFELLLLNVKPAIIFWTHVVKAFKFEAKSHFICQLLLQQLVMLISCLVFFLHILDIWWAISAFY